MSDPRRRLRLVTEAAYTGQDPAAAKGTEVDMVAEAAGVSEREQYGRVLPAEGGAAEQDSPLGAGEGSSPEGRPLGADDWTPPEASTRGHRWGTPVLLAVRLGVVVLVLAVAATVAIVLTRPSAPAHQPDLAWPEPPADWVGAAPGDGETGTGSGDTGAGHGGPDGDSGADGNPGAEGGPDPAGGAEPGGAGDASEGMESPPGGDGGGGSLLVVHVAGAVHTPGIVELPAHARVHEAITAAGGATDEADVAALNLAAPVQDGQQIYVPLVGEEPRPNPPDAQARGENAPGGAPGPATSADEDGAVVDLNNATAADLQTLPGIGPAIADRILTHRDQHGPFGSVEDLLAVSGIGPATMERLRDRVRV